MMKQVIKLAILFLCFAIFSNVHASEMDNAAEISKALADSAKKSLLGDEGKFPLKVKSDYEITNISANNNNVVFEYKMPTDSKNTALNEFIENVRLGIKGQFCDKPDVFNVLNTYDIGFIFQFEFSDKRKIPVTLSIKEICL